MSIHASAFELEAKNVFHGEAPESDDDYDDDDQSSLNVTPNSVQPAVPVSLDTQQAVVTEALVSGEASESDEESYPSSVSRQGLSSSFGGAPVARFGGLGRGQRIEYNSLLHKKLREANSRLNNNVANMSSKEIEAGTRNLKATGQMLTKSKQAVQLEKNGNKSRNVDKCSVMPRDLPDPSSAFLPSDPKCIDVDVIKTSEMAFVTHMIDPWNFWAIVGSEKDLRDFAEFERVIDAYATGAVRTRLRNDSLVPNQTVICRSAARPRWVRGVVMSTMPDDDESVDVMFSDYGSSEFVARRDIIGNITSAMRDRPCLAVACRLAGIKPTDDSGAWSVSACEFFSEQVLYREFSVEVFRDKSSYCAKLVIYPDAKEDDPEGSQVQSVNELMVSVGLAERDDEHSNVNFHTRLQQLPRGHVKTSTLSETKVQPSVTPFKPASAPAPRFDFLKPRSSASAWMDLSVGPLANGSQSSAAVDLEAEEFIKQCAGDYEQKFETHTDTRVRVERPSVQYRYTPEARGDNRLADRGLDLNAELSLCEDYGRGDDAQHKLAVALSDSGCFLASKYVHRRSKDDCRKVLSDQSLTNDEIVDRFFSRIVGKDGRGSPDAEELRSCLGTVFQVVLSDPAFTDRALAIINALRILTSFDVALESVMRQCHDDCVVGLCRDKSSVPSRNFSEGCLSGWKSDGTGAVTRDDYNRYNGQQSRRVADVVSDRKRSDRTNWRSKDDVSRHSPCDDDYTAIQRFSSFLGRLYVTSDKWDNKLSSLDSTFTFLINSWMTMTDDDSRTKRMPAEACATCLCCFLETVAGTSIDLVYDRFSDVLTVVRTLVLSRQLTMQAKGKLLDLLLNVQSFKSENRIRSRSKSKDLIDTASSKSTVATSEQLCQSRDIGCQTEPTVESVIKSISSSHLAKSRGDKNRPLRERSHDDLVGCWNSTTDASLQAELADCTFSLCETSDGESMRYVGQDVRDVGEQFSELGRNSLDSQMSTDSTCTVVAEARSVSPDMCYAVDSDSIEPPLLIEDSLVLRDRPNSSSSAGSNMEQRSSSASSSLGASSSSPRKHFSEEDWYDDYEDRPHFPIASIPLSKKESDASGDDSLLGKKKGRRSREKGQHSKGKKKAVPFDDFLKTQSSSGSSPATWSCGPLPPAPAAPVTVEYNFGSDGLDKARSKLTSQNFFI